MNEREPVRVEFRDVSRVFHKGRDEIAVLKNMNLVIEPGDVVSVVGASGVGKSTFLHILGTLDRPTSGSVLFNGEDVFARDHKRLARFRNATIGFVFQFHHLLPGFSAIENVQLPAVISGMDLAGARRRARDMLEAVGLGGRLEHQPGELSGGEQQRVAIARAMVMHPRLLLADEPTGNLDADTGESIHELFLELNRIEGVTLVIVTHNLELARKTPRRLRMIGGRLIDARSSDVQPPRGSAPPAGERAAGLLSSSSSGDQ